MRNLKLGFAFLFLLVGSVVNAQKHDFTLEDAIMKQGAFYGQRMYALQWTKNADEYSYYAVEGAIKISNLKGEEQTITLDDFNSSLEESKKLEQVPFSITWLNKNTFQFTANDRVYQYSIKDKTATVKYIYRPGAENLDFTKNGNHLAYTIDNNLYISSADGEKIITNDDVESNIVNGQAVHRVEFGITKGTYWSPKGDVLAYYRKDESMVEDYPIVNVMAREAKEEAIKYPMAGMTSEQVTLVLYNVKTQKKVTVKTEGPKEQYLTNIAWSPDQKYIYIAILNRDQTDVALNQYDATTGEFVKNIFKEHNDIYVQALHKMEFIPGRNNEFLWRSERDGYDHFYRYNTNGELLNQVTKGNWAVIDLISLDKNYVYFSATANNGLDRVIYKSSVRNSKSKLLTKTSGVHTASISADKKYILDSWSNVSTPTTVDLLKTSNGSVVKNLLKQDNPLANVNIGKIELGTIKAADGKTDLNTRTIYPANFDKTKKYPVLVYVYNGPGVQLILNSWLARSSMWMPYLANQDYIVFTVDGRGSENRGIAFEQITFRHLGDIEMEDQIKGVEHLKSLPYVDGNRIAVHGWSYGGFMTTNLMTTYPKVFTTGVAGGPVIDWKWYEVMYGERYMDTPENNPEGYASSSLLHKAKNLEGKLLLIHGDIDPTVVLQHSMRFIKQCVDDGVQVDYFIYPQHEHNVRGKDRVHLMTKVLNYIQDNNK
jgi:dipeptidyl-peptidase-4